MTCGEGLYKLEFKKSNQTEKGQLCAELKDATYTQLWASPIRNFIYYRYTFSEVERKSDYMVPNIC